MVKTVSLSLFHQLFQTTSVVPNNLQNELKNYTNLNMFKHKIKEQFFWKVRQEHKNSYFYN